MNTIARHSPHVLCSRIYPTDHHRSLERAQQHCRLHRQRSLRHELLEQRVVLDAGYSFLDSFESGLGSDWEVPELAGDGVVEITGDFSVNAGGHALWFGSTAENPGDELNEAILTLDLAGAERPILTFQQFEGTLGGGHGDRNDALGESHVVLAGSVVRPASALGDGLSVSNDGVHWYKLRDIRFDPDGEFASEEDRAEAGTINRSGNGLWMLHEYDLEAELTRINGNFPDADLEFAAGFRIKFSQYGDQVFPDGGWAIDKVQVADDSQLFDMSLEPDVFHRLTLPGEDPGNFHYRLGMFGSIDATTPIVLSVHGSGHGNPWLYTTPWQQVLRYPPGYSDDVIILAPLFVENADYHRYNRLSWGENADGRTADGVTLDLVEHVVAGLEDALGGLHDHPLYIYGHSAGGQFTERFVWAHPDRIAAAVIGAPGFRTFPDPDVLYPYGLGVNPENPAPLGINLEGNLDEFLSSRIMFWVGDRDKAPDDATAETGLANAQGYGRLHRALNVFEADTAAALARVPFLRDFEFEMFVSEDQSHVGKDWEDFADVYEFLFREVDYRQPVTVHPIVVHQATSDGRRASLPQGTQLVAPGSEFYLELWAESPGGLGIESGSVEVFYDTDLVDVFPLDVEHGVFTEDATHVIDAAAGRIRGLGGRTEMADVGVGEYALLGRLHFRVGPLADPVPSQIALALQRDTATFQLASDTRLPVHLLPVPRLEIGSTARVRGTVFLDLDGDGVQDSQEPGLAGHEVRLEVPLDTVFWVTADVQPYVGPSDYEEGTVVTDASQVLNITASGTQPLADSVGAVAPRSDLPARKRMAWWGPAVPGENSSPDSRYWNTLWQDGQADMRIEFATPTRYVSVTAYGGPTAGRARLRAFNTADELVAETITSTLFPDQIHILELSRPETDIAYVLASSDAGSPGVYFESVASLTQVVSTTDEMGHYELPDLDRLLWFAYDRFRTSLRPAAGWEFTSPMAGHQSLVLGEGEIHEGIDFGVVPTGDGLPDLVGDSLVLVDRRLAGADANEVQFAVHNNSFRPGAAFNVRFYLSEDPLIDPADPRDLLLPLAGSSDTAWRFADGIDSYSTLSQSVQLAPPSVDPFAGQSHYYIGMVIDSEDEVTEQDESNNQNSGLTLDMADVTYAIPAAFPYREDWETGMFSAAWERIPGQWSSLPDPWTGRIEITDRWEPYAGNYHVILDDDDTFLNEAVNQLILHVNLAGQETAILSFANREWNDPDSPEDVIEYSVDGGAIWFPIVELTGERSTNEFQSRAYVFGRERALTADTLIRFQNSATFLAPSGGMALDDIEVLPARPDLFATSFSVSPSNLLTTTGTATVDFEVNNSMPVDANAVDLTFYLSPDEHIDPAADLRLTLSPADPHYDDAVDHATYQLSRLRARTDVAGTVLLTVPETDPFDGGNHYYLGMVIDAENTLPETNEENNANSGGGIDLQSVTYISPASTPFFEGWESTQFSDAWELISGDDGHVVITTDHGPFQGMQHLILEDSHVAEPDALNQVILHVDLEGQSQVHFSLAHREWSDEDDIGEDKISLSVDGGESWRTITHLVHTVSTNAYTWRTFDLDELELTYSADTLIRFQQRGNASVPADGMAFDNIAVGPESVGPHVIRHAPFRRVLPGTQEVRFTFSEPMDSNSFAVSEDVVSFVGPGGTDLLGDIQGWSWASDTTLVIKTLPLIDAGAYSMLIGPNIADGGAAVNVMDQNQDGRKGEVPGDQYRASFYVVDALHFADMESDPGWTLDPGATPYQWQRGVPLGGGAQVPGPSSAVSGANVLGYNLAGNYGDNHAAEYATTPAINATGFEHVVLSFFDWLSIEQNPLDQAALQVSSDGSTWTTVYENPPEQLFATQWSYREFDISPIADRQPTIYVRWSMGPTNDSATYAGWYLDDVLISGIPVDPSLPAIHITDTQGDSNDHAIDFGRLSIRDAALAYDVTISNRGSVQDLDVHSVILSDTTNYSLTWDRDGVPPSRIAAGEERVVSITFDPSMAGTHDATLTIESADPDPADAVLHVNLTGIGTAAATYGWIRTIGGPKFDAATAIQLDHLGNMLIAGFFEGSLDFDPDPIAKDIHAAKGSRDIFVSKFSPVGDYLWTWTAGGEQADEARDLAIDASGNVLITGEFRKQVEFGDQVQLADGFNDVFVSKLGPDGKHQWTRTFGGADGDTGEGIATDSKGHVFVVGSFRGTVDFDRQGSGDAHQSKGQSDVFLTQFDAQGTYLGTDTIGGTSLDLGTAVSVSPQGNVVLTGMFFGNVDFNPGDGEDYRKSNGLYDVFVTSLEPDGGYAWTWTMGGSDDEEVLAVAHDDQGRVYFTGGYQGTVLFNAPQQSDARTSEGSYDIFVTQLTAQGEYGWTRVMGGSSMDFGRAVAIGQQTGLLVAGSFRDAVDFNLAGKGDVHTSIGQTDAFVTSLSLDGVYEHTYTAGGAGLDAALDVAAGSAFAAGYFEGSADFDPTDGIDQHSSAGSADLFAGRLFQPSLLLTEIHGSGWDDLDADGIRDAGEPAREGWAIFLDADEDGLYDSGEERTFTAADGSFAFRNLEAGVYQVAAARRNGWTPTNPGTGSHTVVLDAGDVVDAIDFGAAPPGLLGDWVWHDQNGDGLQQPTEPGLSGVIVRLLTATSVSRVIDTAVSDTAGRYDFIEVAPGDYLLEFQAPAGYTLTIPDRGDDDSRDSDVSWTTHQTEVFRIAPAVADMDWDAGFVVGTLGIISGRVWDDTNGNGLQDTGESGVSGVGISLHEDFYSTFGATTTGRDGRYAFVGVPASTYFMRFTPPGGASFTYQNVGTDDRIDSDVHATDRTIESLVVAAGTRDLHQDAGLLRLDYGDALGASYPTLAADGGAVHRIVSGVFLGLGIEGDPDGQPAARALGDDVGDGSDDEDGIEFTSAVVPGSEATLIVTASVPGKLDGWIDFGLDGSWVEASDRIFRRQDLHRGSNELTFLVPDTAILGATVGRFRFSKNGVPTYSGFAADGEVEDHEVVIEAVDWGDTPDMPRGPFFQTLTAPDPEWWHQLGQQVDIYGGWAVASAVGDGESFGGNGAAYLYQWNGADWLLYDKLVSSDNSAGDQFASDVAINGNWIVVGARYDDSHGEDELGAAYVFHWDGTTWSETQKLTPSDPRSYLAFGGAVELSGDRLIVGASESVPGWVYGGSNRNGPGAAYVFHWDGTSWNEIQKLQPPPGEGDLAFGKEVAIFDEWAIVSAADDSDPDTDTGAVYAFHWNGTRYEAPQKLDYPAGTTGDWFGRSFSLSGDRLLVGMDEAAAVYHLVAGVWEAAQTVTAWDGVDPNGFGYSVALDAGWALIGARGDDEVDINAGAAYLFRFDATGWVEHQKLVRYVDLARGDTTGTAVALHGNRAILGAPSRYHLGIEYSGTAYMVRWLPVLTDYPTLFVNDGARHSYDPSIYLGAGFDFEGNGRVSSSANGDDLDRADDEDGVELSILMPGGTATATVTVSTEGYLNAWIDFNHDGDWKDPGEQVFAGQSVMAGSHTLDFVVPDWATITTKGDPTFARFRFSRQENLGFAGLAGDGEVEDYAVEIFEPGGELRGRVFDDLDGDGLRGFAEPFLDGRTVELLDAATGVRIASQLTYAVDLNGDSVLDPASEGGWYRFSGLPIGDFVVQVLVPEDWQITLPQEPSTYSLTLKSAVQLLVGNDFGIRLRGASDDTDLDGVLDLIEDAAPHGGDGNEDGVADRLQPHVASLPSHIPGQYATLVAPEYAKLGGVLVRDNPDTGSAPEGIDFNVGFFEFRVENLAQGSAITVGLMLSKAEDLNAFHFFGPTPASPNDAWHPFIYHGQTGAEFLSDRVALHLQDGGLGDADLLKNGSVAILAAPGWNRHPVPWRNPVFEFDVNADQYSSPIDALLVINEINRHGSRALPVPPVPPFLPPYYFDPSGDGYISPIDALMVINHLNKLSRGEGEQVNADTSSRINPPWILPGVASSDTRISRSEISTRWSLSTPGWISERGSVSAIDRCWQDEADRGLQPRRLEASKQEHRLPAVTWPMAVPEMNTATRTQRMTAWRHVKDQEALRVELEDLVAQLAADQLTSGSAG